MENRNKTERWCRYLKKLAGLVSCLVMAGAVLSVGWIMGKGIPEFTTGLFSYSYTDGNFSLFPALISTFYMTAGVLLLSVPSGILTGLWLSGFSAADKQYGVLSLLIDCLNGMPSILYGLFGFLFFVVFMGMGYSMLSGILVLSMLILPWIIRTAEESFRRVPESYRKAGEALGITRCAMLRCIILPQALPEIASGVVMAAARISGAAAALLYTSGTVPQVPGGLFDSGRTLAVHVYLLSSEDTGGGSVYAAMVVLILVTGIFNELAFYLTGRWKHE